MRNKNQPRSYARNVKGSYETFLWHLRCGHLSFHNLSILKTKCMVKCLPLLDANHDPCESYILVKHQRDSFPNVVNYRARVALELVHTNLFEPMQTQ